LRNKKTYPDQHLVAVAVVEVEPVVVVVAVVGFDLK